MDRRLDMLEAEYMYITPEQEITFMNRAKRENFPHVRPGQKCYEVLESYGHRCPRCVAHEAMEKREEQKNPHYVAMNPDGSVRHINITATPVIDEQGAVIGAIEAVYDITDLTQANMQLERLNKEYENVIYALSHDLRSPLVSIEGFIRKLTRNHVDMTDDKAIHCINRIRANVRMMNDFVKVLLDTSRITTGELQREDADINEVVEDVLGQFQEHADKNNITLATDGEFPIVACDRVRMMQVFSNLLGNALSHCETTPDLKIEIGYRANVFWVRDNGPGMEAQVRDTVFEPFSQGASNDGSHFGMGMNIVYKIMQKHGGDAWIESSPGKGTCVYFTLAPNRGRVTKKEHLKCDATVEIS